MKSLKISSILGINHSLSMNLDLLVIHNLLSSISPFLAFSAIFPEVELKVAKSYPSGG